jgi:AP-1 complex subunit mu
MTRSCSRAPGEVCRICAQSTNALAYTQNVPAARGKAIEMEDVKFHQCVRLSRFENDRTISFIPPDGEFELMSYRLSTPVKPLIWVEAAVESHKGSRVEYMVKCKAQFKRRSTANNVEIYVPVPDDADSPKFRVSMSLLQFFFHDGLIS